MKPAHRRGTYYVESRRITAAARNNPATRCWRCGRLPHEHPRHNNGTIGRWNSGHVIDGDPNSPMLPEWSTCNLSAGGKLGAAITQARKHDAWF